MTDREFYTALLNEEIVRNTTHYREKTEQLIERLDKKNASRSTKPTKAQLLTIAIKDKIFAEMANNPNRLYTATELATILNNREETDTIVSNQRATVALKKLVEEGRAEKVAEKRTTYFKAIV